jgi:LAS superfamily LD-carboxypeptidase LdcB
MKKFLIVVLLSVVCLGVNVQAQTTTPQTAPRSEEETNLETHLFLIVATHQESADSKLPPALDNVAKQLRASLPFKNYRLVSTLINRVKNEGSLKLNWVGAPMTSVATTAPTTPSFSHFNIRQVKLVRDNEGQQMIQMAGFSFGARVPIQMSAIAAGGEVRPTTSYEQTGLGTDISMREGEPVIVGTLNVGPSGDAIILVVSAKRATK